MDIYQVFLRPLLFSGLKADPELVHWQTLQILGWLQQPSHSFIKSWVKPALKHSFSFVDAHLEQQLWGLKFSNPVGLAAGFDKDGIAAGMWSIFGFGLAEIGTVTLEAQAGNPRPRLFRLLSDRAALNRMGFNNCGAKAMVACLSDIWQQHSWNDGGKQAQHGSVEGRAIPIGINLGKSKVTPLAEATADYLGSFRLLKNWGDYFVINVSSPNTPGLRSLQAVEQLQPILTALQQENHENKPILIKISPDLSWEDIAAILDLARTHHLSGIIATNTTVRRDGLQTQIVEATGKRIVEEPGGISGLPLRQRSTEVIRFIWRQTEGKLPIIGVGGIFTAEDAWEKIAAGASLIQVYTGWIYEGPWMVRRILTGLLQKLQERGMDAIADAVGSEN